MILCAGVALVTAFCVLSLTLFGMVYSGRVIAGDEPAMEPDVVPARKQDPAERAVATGIHAGARSPAQAAVPRVRSARERHDLDPLG
jgi:hypothetical protein